MWKKKYFYFILSVEGGSITLKNTFYKYFSSAHYGHKRITRLLKIATNLANAKLCMDWSTSKFLQILNTVPGMMLWFWSLRIIIKFHTTVLLRKRKILRQNFLIGQKKKKNHIALLGEAHRLKPPTLARYHSNHLHELFYDRRSW